ILDDFYERSFAGLNPAVRVFVEDRLLTASGFRSTVPLEESTQAGIAAEDIHTLVDRRLTRVEERLGIPHLELTHDLLCNVVQKSRAGRHEREQVERERRKREADEKERQERAAAREQQERAELERARRDLEQAQALAEAQQRRAEAERQKAEEQQRRLDEKARTASRLRNLIVGIIAIGLLAVSAIFFAVHYIRQAATAAKVANEKSEAAAIAEKIAKERGEAAAIAHKGAAAAQELAHVKTEESLKQQALAET